MKKPEFLYHGSSINSKVLLPKQAENWINKASGLYGVYATHIRNIALAFTLGGISDGSGTVSMMIKLQNSDPIKMVYIHGYPNFGGKGYLYKLNSRIFKQINTYEWICGQTVVPITVTEINVDDHLHLFRYANEKEKKEFALKNKYDG